MWDLWDNLDGSSELRLAMQASSLCPHSPCSQPFAVERGYSGASIVFPLSPPQDINRVVDLARLLASIGLNAIVWDNVNACGNGNEYLLNSTNLALLAPLAATLHSYGIHSFLTPCWTAPQTVGGLNSSDPRDARVTAWWASKITEAHAALGAGVLRGLLFKGDTEGQPGPGLYNWTELQGANYFGALLANASNADPLGMVCVWRAFAHPPNGHDMPQDQALYQFQRFEGWEGQTLPNVVLQIKNGPYDFQVREPVHALFGRLPHVNIILELEATPEYLGQERHLMALPPQWSSYLSFDLCTQPGAPTGGDTTLAGVIAGGPYGNQFSGVAAVSNFGADSK